MWGNFLFECIYYTILKKCIVLYNSLIFAIRLKTLVHDKFILLKNNKIPEINSFKKTDI